MNITLTDSLRVRADVIFGPLDDESVLLDLFRRAPTEERSPRANKTKSNLATRSPLDRPWQGMPRRGGSTARTMPSQTQRKSRRIQVGGRPGRTRGPLGENQVPCLHPPQAKVKGPTLMQLGEPRKRDICSNPQRSPELR